MCFFVGLVCERMAIHLLSGLKTGCRNRQPSPASGTVLTSFPFVASIRCSFFSFSFKVVAARKRPSGENTGWPKKSFSSLEEAVTRPDAISQHLNKLSLVVAFQNWQATRLPSRETTCEDALRCS